MGVPWRTLSGCKMHSHNLIDEAAGVARMRYITDTPGQQAVYLLKRDEALALQASPASTPGPHIAAEAVVLGLSVQQVVASIVAQNAHWTGVLSPAIESARMGGKAAVRSAADVPGVLAALDAALVVLNGL